MGQPPHAWPIGDLPEADRSPAALWQAYRLRLRRQVLLARAMRRRSQLTPLVDRTAAIRPGDILGFLCVRNEAQRLPFVLDHHRRLGVRHFLVVDNASTDGTPDLLRDQPDISLWQTGASYKASRFGMDWLTWLMLRHGHGHWCLTLDADEILVYPHWQTRPLPALTDWLDRQGQPCLGALTVDLYPEGPVSRGTYAPGDDPTRLLQWFDSGNYQVQVQPRMRNLWIQGGARARAFFAQTPRPRADAEQDPAGALALALCLCQLDPRASAIAPKPGLRHRWRRVDLGRPAAHQVPARHRRPLGRGEGARGTFRRCRAIRQLLRSPDPGSGVAYPGFYPLHRMAPA